MFVIADEGNIHTCDLKQVKGGKFHNELTGATQRDLAADRPERASAHHATLGTLANPPQTPFPDSCPLARAPEVALETKR